MKNYWIHFIVDLINDCHNNSKAVTGRQQGKKLLWRCLWPQASERKTTRQKKLLWRCLYKEKSYCEDACTGLWKEGSNKKIYCEDACGQVVLWIFRLHFEPSGLPPLPPLKNLPLWADLLLCKFKPAKVKTRNVLWWARANRHPTSSPSVLSPSLTGQIKPNKC